jgi:hypothetical protein
VRCCGADAARGAQAYIMDTNEEERAKGKTVEARARFVRIRARVRARILPFPC